MPRIRQGRGLIDVLLGRPKEDFYTPSTWPEKHPDYGFRQYPPKNKFGLGKTVDKSETDNS